LKTWKKIILGILAFIFMITLPFTITWYSVTGTIFNVDTYKPVIHSALNEFASPALTEQNITLSEETLAPLESKMELWIDSILKYLNGKGRISFELPSDEELKPILKEIVLKTQDIELTNEEFEYLYNSQSRTLLAQFKDSIKNTEEDLERELSNTKEAIVFFNNLAKIVLILNILIVIIAILLIRQIRTTFNWLGTYLLLGALPLFITGIAIIAGTSTLVTSFSVPVELASGITSIVSTILSNLIIWSAIISGIGLILLLTKYFFKKSD